MESLDGSELKLTIADKPSIATLVKATLADIKQNSFVEVTSMPQPDGTLEGRAWRVGRNGAAPAF